MSKDVLYTNGVIAVREKNLLKDKLFKFCESSPQEVFRSLTESGFGKGAEVSSVYEYERLLAADEEDLDAFIREYAPTDAERVYLLSPRDFHNAKAAVKAEYLKLPADEAAALYAPDGLIPAEEIISAVKSGDYAQLPRALAAACTEASALLNDENEESVSGADIGIVFDKALFGYLSKACKGNAFLKKCVRYRADMTNILTALRSRSGEDAEKNYVGGGFLNEKQLALIFSEDGEVALHALDKTTYGEFYKNCLKQKNDGLPMTAAERNLDSLETFLLAKHKYELRRAQPFLYYVFRRRAENANLRILFVCLLAGMDERDIKNRLRKF